MPRGTYHSPIRRAEFIADAIANLEIARAHASAARCPEMRNQISAAIRSAEIAQRGISAGSEPRSSKHPAEEAGSGS